MVDTKQMTNNENVVADVRESIKLIKNSRGYNWEIKVKDDLVKKETTCKRLHEINTELEEKYGTE